MTDNTPASNAAMAHADLTERVIGIFYDVYNELGSGFLESVYENALTLALKESGLDVVQQAPLEVRFRNAVVGQLRADLLVSGNLIVDVKVVTRIMHAHEAQLVNYLKATGHVIGLLVNFGPHPQVKRRVLNMSHSFHSGAIGVESDV